MEISLADALQILSFIGVIYAAWWANRAMNLRAPAQKRSDDVTSLGTANEAIEGAFKRAREAEAEWEKERESRRADRISFEKMHEENKNHIAKLEAAFEDYKKKHNRYMVAFTMKFTEDDPIIENVHGYRDRREPHTQPYKGEERRGKE